MVKFYFDESKNLMTFVGNKLMRIVRQLRTGIVKVVGIVEVPIDIPIGMIVVVDMDIAGTRNKIIVAEDIASIPSDIVVMVVVMVAALHGAIGLISEGIFMMLFLV